MFACNNWGDRVGLAGSALNASVSELSSLLFETGLDGSGVTVVVLSLLNRDNVVVVGFW